MDEDMELTHEILTNHRSYCWAHLAQLSSDKAVEIVEMILNYCPKRCKVFSKLYDEHGRQVVDIASPKCKLAILQRLWLHRRYEVRLTMAFYYSLCLLFTDSDGFSCSTSSCAFILRISTDFRTLLITYV